MSPPPRPATDPEARQKQSEALARTSALLLSEDFAWFRETCLRAKMKEASEQALSTKSDDRDRDRAAHVHDALAQVEAWAEQTAEAARQFIHGS